MRVDDSGRAGVLSIAYYKGRKALNPAAKWGDQLICAWPRSRGNFSHAEMVFGYEPTSTLSWCASSSGRDDGVRFKSIDLKSGRWMLRHIVGADDQSFKRANDWFVDHLGMPYDYLGLAGFVLPGRLQLDRAVYCSEACLLACGSGAKQVSPSALFARHDELFGDRVL